MYIHIHTDILTHLHTFILAYTPTILHICILVLQILMEFDSKFERLFLQRFANIVASTFRSIDQFDRVKTYQKTLDTMMYHTHLTLCT